MPYHQEYDYCDYDPANPCEDCGSVHFAVSREADLYCKHCGLVRASRLVDVSAYGNAVLPDNDHYNPMLSSSAHAAFGEMLLEAGVAPGASRGSVAGTVARAQSVATNMESTNEVGERRLPKNNIFKLDKHFITAGVTRLNLPKVVVTLADQMFRCYLVKKQQQSASTPKQSTSTPRQSMSMPKQRAAYAACTFWAARAPVMERKFGEDEVAAAFGFVDDKSAANANSTKKAFCAMNKEVRNAFLWDPAWNYLILDQVVTSKDFIKRMADFALFAAKVPLEFHRKFRLECDNVLAKVSAVDAFANQDMQVLNVAIILYVFKALKAPGDDSQIRPGLKAKCYRVHPKKSDELYTALVKFFDKSFPADVDMAVSKEDSPAGPSTPPPPSVPKKKKKTINKVANSEKK